MDDRKDVQKTKRSRTMSASGGDGGEEAGTSSRMYKKRPRNTPRRQKAALETIKGAGSPTGRRHCEAARWWLCSPVAVEL